jgi:phage protein D
VKIAELEKRHGDFYVPSFVVKVGGEDLVRDLYLAVASVSVDLKEKAAGRFTFKVVSAFDWKAGEFLATRAEKRIDLLELFAFGTSIEVAIGYGDPSKLKPILTGLITEITTDFRSGSTPELSISGYDDLYRLMIGTHSRPWEDVPDSVAVEDVARRRRITTDVRPTTPTKPRIDQNNETDLAFVGRLAKRNHATFYQRGGKLYFGPENLGREDVALEWGQGLVSFSPEANLATQVGEVRLHAWSAESGEPIVGTARRGQESGRDTRSSSGGELVVTALAEEPMLSRRAALHTQAEADSRAKAVLEERAEGFVTGSGESIGLPELVPDTNVALTGLGRGFTKTYYLSEATHIVDGSGYRTSFKVRKPTVRKTTD